MAAPCFLELQVSWPYALCLLPAKEAARGRPDAWPAALSHQHMMQSILHACQMLCTEQPWNFCA